MEVRMSKREKYIDRMSVKLKEWDKEIEKLELKAANATDNVKHTYQEQVDEVREKMSNTRNKLDDISSAGSDSWLELKKGFKVSFKMFRESFKKAKKKFKKGMS